MLIHIFNSNSQSSNLVEYFVITSKKIISNKSQIKKIGQKPLQKNDILPCRNCFSSVAVSNFYEFIESHSE
jgi:hypothetical protein